MTPVAVFWSGIIAAIVYLPFSENAPNWARSAVKALPMLALMTTSILAGGPVLLAVALAFTGLGDFALSRPGPRAFLAGLLAFAAAHVFYFLLFTALSGRGPYMAFVDRWLLALFLVWVALSTELWLTPHAGRLKWAVRVYVGAIALMVLSALTLPLGALTIGVVYLVTAEVIFGYRAFRMDEDDPLSGRAIWMQWVLHVAGHALVVVGVLNRVVG